MTRFTRRGPARGALPSGNTLRPVEWIRSCWPLATAPAVGVAEYPLVGGVDFDAFTRPTVVRIRGEVFLYCADTTLGTAQTFVMGITMTNPNELAPNPFVEARGNRWLWWHCATLLANPTLESGTSAVRIEFDVKSMRKRLVEGSSLRFVIAGTDPAAPNGVFAVGASTLVKE